MKKNNLIKKIFILLLIIPMFMLSGCTNGLSAYEIAVKNGFAGTEIQWLDSLKQGESAYDIAVNNGFVGTETEWLESLKISAYEIAVKNGFIGTETEWLESLNGSDGADRVLQSLYSDLVESNEFTGTFEEFITDYILHYEISDETLSINKALRSTVSVYSTFTKTVNSLMGGTSEEQYSAAGSGIIYKLDEFGNAYIITNFHVVFDNNSNSSDHIANEIKIFLYGSEYADYAIATQFIGGSMTYDIAILKVELNLQLIDGFAKQVTVADSNNILVGETSIAIGNAEAEGITVTKGIISVDSEVFDMPALDDSEDIEYRVMRIDTAVNHGNSGGGLFNVKGELIGIVNAKKTDTDIENMGYALPSTQVKYVADNLIDNYENDNLNRKVNKYLLGIGIKVDSSKAVYDEVNLTTKIVETVKIDTISDTSIALNYLESGDILKEITINNVTINIDRIFKITEFMLTARLNDVVSIKITRENIEHTYNFTMASSNLILVK